MSSPASLRPRLSSHGPRAEPRRPVVLLVEDNPGDAELTREALADRPAPGGLSSAIHLVHDGVEALAFLRREREYAAAPRPDLVLLDLNLPRLDGRGVIARVKQDPLLRQIPVVVLSSSAAERDVTCAYALGANCYVTKGPDLAEFFARVQAIEQFWTAVALLPPLAHA